MKVPLLDLKIQYQSLKKELDEAVLKTAESQYFILGPEVKRLEEEVADFLRKHLPLLDVSDRVCEAAARCSHAGQHGK